MKRSQRLLSVLAVTGWTLLAALVLSACFVTTSGAMRGTVAYSEPPPPQVEPVDTRPGYVWIQGRWDYQGGQWVWINGRWDVERQGYQYRNGQWVQRGGSWHWVEGEWVAVGGYDGGGVGGNDGGSAVVPGNSGAVIVNDASNANGGVVVTDRPDQGSSGGAVVVGPAPGGQDMYPTQAPPAVRVETYGARPGYVWITGRWDWRNNNWVWIDGHWERARARQQWVPGRWESRRSARGSYYIWIEGSWR